MTCTLPQRFFACPLCGVGVALGAALATQWTREESLSAFLVIDPASVGVGVSLGAAGHHRVVVSLLHCGGEQPMFLRVSTDGWCRGSSGCCLRRCAFLVFDPATVGVGVALGAAGHHRVVVSLLRCGGEQPMFLRVSTDGWCRGSSGCCLRRCAFLVVDPATVSVGVALCAAGHHRGGVVVALRQQMSLWLHFLFCASLQPFFGLEAFFGMAIQESIYSDVAMWHLGRCCLKFRRQICWCCL